MTANTKDQKAALERAIRAVRWDEPSMQVLSESRARLEARLFGPSDSATGEGPIAGCDAIEAMLAAYRRGELGAPRALLVRHHLTECSRCRDLFTRRGNLHLATTAWKRGAALRVEAPQPRRTGVWMLAAAVLLGIAVMITRSAWLLSPTGPLAIVQTISGSLYRIDGSNAHRLDAGAELSDGQVVRAGTEPQSVLRLTDGTLVEMGERAEFSIVARGHDTTLRLNRGQVIVQAAKRRSGHLYVSAYDCRVAVTGTVFSVLTGVKGSRVSVIEGKVTVSPSSGRDQDLARGDQITTSSGVSRVPIEQDIAWSRNLDEHLALLRQLSDLRQDWDTLRAPDLRFESQLVRLVPDSTAVYAALPNYAELVGEGYRLFKARLKDSSVLQKWWNHAGTRHADLDDMMAKMQELSTFIGNEVVLSGSFHANEPEVTLLAEVSRAGLGEYVGHGLRSHDGKTIPLTVVDEQHAVSLAHRGNGADGGAILLVSPRFVALSSSPDAIAEVARRLGSNQEGAFTGSRLGERVSQAYRRGVGLLLAADLEMLTAATVEAQRKSPTERAPAYLMFERRGNSAQAINSAELVFDGPREGVASWLAEPGPMGSLEFFTPQTSAIAAFLVKRPTEVLDDLLRTTSGKALLPLKFEASDQKLADALGNEIAVALDGPLLPMPAWKLVVEVQDAVGLQQALEALVRRADRELKAAGIGALVFDHERIGNHTQHRISTRNTRIPFEVDYVIVDGYLVMTPSRALLDRALDAHERGETLGRSRKFSALLPRDGQASVSGFFYQDLMDAVASALSSAGPVLTANQRQELLRLRGETRASLVGFYGRMDRIEVASAGDLIPIGPEALALPGLIQQVVPEHLPVNWQ